MTIHFFQNRPKFRCIQLTAWKIDGLGLFWPESIYLIDPPELKPVGFVWVGCPPNRESKSLWAVGLKSQFLDTGFSRGLHLVCPGYCKTLIELSYTGISFVFRDIPALVPEPDQLLPSCLFLLLLAYSFFLLTPFFSSTRLHPEHQPDQPPALHNSNP